MTDLPLERLRLREWREDDWVQAHLYASDPEVVRYLDWGPNTEEETRAFIRGTMQTRQASPRTRYDLAVALAEREEVIGGCRIWIESAEHREASIGYSLARPHWGSGYATELARGLLRFGFETLGMHRIWAIRGAWERGLRAGAGEARQAAGRPSARPSLRQGTLARLGALRHPRAGVGRGALTEAALRRCPLPDTGMSAACKIVRRVVPVAETRGRRMLQ